MRFAPRAVQVGPSEEVAVKQRPIPSEGAWDGATGLNSSYRAPGVVIKESSRKAGPDH